VKGPAITHHFGVAPIRVLTALANLAKIIIMKTVTIHDAKTNLSKYIAAALRGEKVYIGSFGEAQVVLSKLSPEEAHKGKRSFAIAKDKIRVTADAFTDFTDQEISSLMLGE
jgi:antitoxin (DNA-binding transcriptional repressor) of toxin-antitoxin stability system